MTAGFFKGDYSGRLYLYGKLTVVQFGVKTIFSKELSMGSLFDYMAVFHYKDNVRILNGRKTMGYYKTCSALHHLLEGMLYFELCPCIDGRCGFVKDKYGRETEHYPCYT